MKSEKIPIIYEDSEIFVINKRQGLAVQGGAGISHSVDSDFAAQVGQKIYLVHRLDKETSGLLLCAKSPSAAAKWTRIVGEKNAEKEYKALCLGAMENPRGKISSDISERGVKKRAETFYETEKIFEIPWESVEENLSGNSEKEKSRVRFPSKISLVRLRLGTGRTHQLRIHLAGAGVPICGDDKYGDFAANRLLKKIGIKRLCLCAFRLTLPLAEGRRTFEIDAGFSRLLGTPREIDESR